MTTKAAARTWVDDDAEIEVELLSAIERLELTEEGWVEKVTGPAHGNMAVRISLRLDRLGVPEGAIFDNTRLGPGPRGLRYAPDVMVVLPTNPVPVDLRRGRYDGAPDLAVEILSGDPQTARGRARRERDTEEKVRRYAERGIPHYWIADPQTGRVRWLRLEGSAYREVWERDLADVTLPWENTPNAR